MEVRITTLVIFDEKGTGIEELFHTFETSKKMIEDHLVNQVNKLYDETFESLRDIESCFNKIHIETQVIRLETTRTALEGNIFENGEKMSTYIDSVHEYFKNHEYYEK